MAVHFSDNAKTRNRKGESNFFFKAETQPYKVGFALQFKSKYEIALNRNRLIKSKPACTFPFTA
jgi:hypothetical protein